MVAVAVVATALVILPVYCFQGLGFLEESDRAGDALRLAESQIETLRGMPAERRPVGAELPAVAGLDALERLPGGTCALSVEPLDAGPGAAPLVRVRVRVGWTAQRGGREIHLSTVMRGPPARRDAGGEPQ